MSWIPAPEAEFNAANLLPAVEAVDEVGFFSALGCCALDGDGAELLPHLHGVREPAHASIDDQQVELATPHRHQTDVVTVAERIDGFEGHVSVLERHAAGDGQQGQCAQESHEAFSDDGWVSSYIGLPFQEKGRTRAGLDCWGLIRLIWLERGGIDLPVWAEGYAETDPCPETSCHLAACARSFAEIQAGQERAGDILLFRTGRHLAHVGLCIGAGRMLHILAGLASAVERYRSPRWLPRLAGVYRV